MAQMDNYRRLQKTCESQAALSSSPETRTALLEMAEEYRKRAESNAFQGPEPVNPRRIESLGQTSRPTLIK
ncbi:hypothetical protein [Bradyrhizobium ottawaense]|nr:hypothetical protein SG09_62700 [Bradyrhizobium ottawaense]GMO18035.1 hypothetical protein BwSH14_08980 [Bradyrhizobium ottawaense]GMO49032.1 hypothetical protein BwSF12_57330 [Bradyrhizobium ottawaense]GMO72674.1 hypothetical protein BwSH17_33000 [Bradyrhizobium ottawaense]GMO83916.1 hypothetical protein BwSG10_60850 [Bradyrhizobium ottawaense]